MERERRPVKLYAPLSILPAYYHHYRCYCYYHYHYFARARSNFDTFDVSLRSSTSLARPVNGRFVGTGRARFELGERRNGGEGEKFYGSIRGKGSGGRQIVEAHHSLIALGLAIERFPREGVAEEVETGKLSDPGPGSASFIRLCRSVRPRTFRTLRLDLGAPARCGRRVNLSGMTISWPLPGFNARAISMQLG